MAFKKCASFVVYRKLRPALLRNWSPNDISVVRIHLFYSSVPCAELDISKSLFVSVPAQAEELKKVEEKSKQLAAQQEQRKKAEEERRKKAEEDRRAVEENRTRKEVEEKERTRKVEADKRKRDFEEKRKAEARR